jgi:hypothetical protein
MLSNEAHDYAGHDFTNEILDLHIHQSVFI